MFRTSANIRFNMYFKNASSYRLLHSDAEGSDEEQDSLDHSGHTPASKSTSCSGRLSSMLDGLTASDITSRPDPSLKPPGTAFKLESVSVNHDTHQSTVSTPSGDFVDALRDVIAQNTFWFLEAYKMLQGRKDRLNNGAFLGSLQSIGKGQTWDGWLSPELAVSSDFKNCSSLHKGLKAARSASVCHLTLQGCESLIMECTGAKVSRSPGRQQKESINVSFTLRFADSKR
jgi:hypothetical protein